MGYGMTAARHFGAQIPMFPATGLVSALACYQLVPNHGLPGAAFAEILAQVTTLTGSVIIISCAIKYAFAKEQVAIHDE
jgi:hypothetical protein